MAYTPPNLLVKRLSPTATLPTRGSARAAGCDLYADLPSRPNGVILPVGGRRVIPTGIAICMEGDMTYGRIAPRSGLASAHGISVLAGVIDADYRGEIGVMLHNTGEFPVTISHGQRIAQLILEVCLNLPIVEVDSLDETARGAHGFGSTGS